jgi:hypothetical protein
MYAVDYGDMRNRGQLREHLAFLGAAGRAEDLITDEARVGKPTRERTRADFERFSAKYKNCWTVWWSGSNSN